MGDLGRNLEEEVVLDLAGFTVVVGHGGSDVGG